MDILFEDAPAWLVLLVVVVGHLVAVLILRVFPDVLTTSLRKRIENRYDAGLEEFRAELDAKNSILGTAVEYVSASQTPLRSKRVEAAESLWSAIRKIETEYRQATNAQSIFRCDELAGFFAQGSHKGIKDLLADYKDLDGIRKKTEFYTELDCEKHRLFSGERLWLWFEVLWRAHGRLGWLINSSFEKRQYVDWREDRLMNDILLSVLPEDVLKQAKTRPVGGFNYALGHLRAGFLKEAAQVMSGSPQIAEDLSDIRSTLQAERQRIRDLEEEPQLNQR